MVIFHGELLTHQMVNTSRVFSGYPFTSTTRRVTFVMVSQGIGFWNSLACCGGSCWRCCHEFEGGFCQENIGKTLENQNLTLNVFNFKMFWARHILWPFVATIMERGCEGDTTTLNDSLLQLCDRFTYLGWRPLAAKLKPPGSLFLDTMILFYSIDWEESFNPRQAFFWDI